MNIIVSILKTSICAYVGITVVRVLKAAHGLNFARAPNLSQ